MDTKISLARQEDGRSVLLAGAGTGEVGEGATHRDQGKEISGDAKGHEGEKVKHPKTKGESHAKAKGRNKGGRRGRNYSLRETIREAKRRNPAPGRSAQELGITWLDARCEDSPVSKAHYLIGRTQVDQGTVFECRYCHKVKWLPNGIDGAQRLGYLLHVYGLDGGYQRMLDEHPAARRLMSKIQDIFYLKKSLPSEHFPIALAAVMLDREYPYDVTITEEDVL